MERQSQRMLLAIVQAPLSWSNVIASFLLLRTLCISLYWEIKRVKEVRTRKEFHGRAPMATVWGIVWPYTIQAL